MPLSRRSSQTISCRASSNFVDLLCRRALDQSDKTAVTFLLDGEDAKESLTYPELDARARAFSDFHLFDHLYGIRDVESERVRALLELMNLTHKTSIVGDKISAVNLSSGERKRLALVLSLLENTPILLLDEWAAEQDPIFRRKFYREILPRLKRQQKTVVAVTHDDDHYDVADRVLKMQFGTFV